VCNSRKTRVQSELQLCQTLIRIRSYVYVRFLGAFAEVQNASIAFVMSINFLSV